MAAVAFNRELKKDAVVDESWFSDPRFCEEQKFWYVLSKTLAEDAAWKFAKEQGINIITINPGFVIGPFLQPSINLSVEMVLNLVNGCQITAALLFQTVQYPMTRQRIWEFTLSLWRSA
ncbi:phenylacetaldehyde reductase-like isoform X3 [Coffea arabica]|uniref:Phenylacetaldehyde reductase-like isoform X3 n=1 Tax=Coffea arabica TaxID=13443 RepID=A0ABM4WIY2_COFAR